MPLSSIYHDGKLETVASGGQPVFTTVLRVAKKPVPSLLRGYSALIRLHSDLTESDLFFLLLMIPMNLIDEKLDKFWQGT
nr:puromycin-sensitive aminopeptidase-like isoform X2 [Tanacetum cinerariifolium]